VRPEEFTVFAGVLPEGKYNLVKAFFLAAGLVMTRHAILIPMLMATPATVSAPMRQALAFVPIVFGNQATTYTNPERLRLGSSRPSRWLVASSVAGLSIASAPAACGIAIAPLPILVVVAALAGAVDSHSS